MGREGMNGRGPRSPRMHAWHSMALACGDVRVHTANCLGDIDWFHPTFTPSMVAYCASLFPAGSQTVANFADGQIIVLARVVFALCRKRYPYRH